MHLEQRALEQRNAELIDAFKDKSKSHQQIQKMYQALKAQAAATQVQAAASDDAEQILHVGGSQAFMDSRGNQQNHSRFPVNGRGIEQIHSRQRSGGSGDDREDELGRQNLNIWSNAAHGDCGYSSRA